MTKGLFAALDIYYNDDEHSAAMNMAIDEALLDSVAVPSIRFYRWDSPALSFGYFGRFADVADYATARDIVRRWTGGGIVFHGDDLTYAIIVPGGDPLFAKSAGVIYEKIHRALCRALLEQGQDATVADVANARTSVSDRGYKHCFANPVRADVMLDGHKVAGAAQRRT